MRKKLLWQSAFSGFSDLPAKSSLYYKHDISQKLTGKIFQPFFTAKPTGEGTGSGLSLSYDIITKGHGGVMTVETEEGKGTAFCIHIPTAAL